MKTIRMLQLISMLSMYDTSVEASNTPEQRTTRLLRMTQACNIFSRNISCVNLYIASSELVTMNWEQLKELLYKHHVQLPPYFPQLQLSEEVRRKQLFNSLNRGLKELILTAKCIEDPPTQLGAYYQLCIENPSTRLCPYYQLSIQRSPQFLKEVCDTLTAYVPTDETDLNYLLANASQLGSRRELGYVRKNTRTVLRILSCALLQQIIQERHLKHVRIPRKFLVIFDKKSKRYYAGDQARNVIYRMFALEFNPYEGTISLVNNLKFRYRTLIFAERCEPAGRCLSSKAIEDMKVLISAGGLFDIGTRDKCNILSDSQGNAMIVDTEARAGFAEDDCLKMFTTHYSEV